jgi:hypothetical protein
MKAPLVLASTVALVVGHWFAIDFVEHAPASRTGFALPALVYLLPPFLGALLVRISQNTQRPRLRPAALALALGAAVFFASVVLELHPATRHTEPFMKNVGYTWGTTGVFVAFLGASALSTAEWPAKRFHSMAVLTSTAALLLVLFVLASTVYRGYHFSPAMAFGGGLLAFGFYGTVWILADRLAWYLFFERARASWREVARADFDGQL